jgi:hypothetical protein
MNDLLHVRQDLHFPLTTISKSKFTAIMEPKSYEDLEKYLPWMSLVRDIFQPRPVIVENTNKELERINSSSEKKDFSSIRQQRYWQNQIFLRWAVEEGLSNGYHKQDLKSWLEDLHKIACSGLDGDNHYYECDTSNGKLSSPSQGIMTRYQEKSTEELKGYLEKFEQFLDLRNSSKNNEDWLVELAEKYVNVTLNAPFKHVNNSIVMNILNLMLQKQGMTEISHSDLDLSFFSSRDNFSFRYNEERLKKARADFSSIFLRAILQTNPMLEEELGTGYPLFNIPVQFVSIYEPYLKQLSELEKSGVLKPETYHLMKYLSVGYLEKKSKLLEEIIKFKDILEKGVQKGVFTQELFTNCFDDISKAFKLSKILFVKRQVLLLESLGLKSLYPSFDTSVSTLEQLVSNWDKEIEAHDIDPFQRIRKLRTEGLNFLNSKDS